AAAVDLANYYGIKIDEYKFQSSLPLSDNPDYGFVGSLNGEWGQIPPAPYGVHAEPIANLISQYKLPVKAFRQMTLNQVKDYINSGHPLIAWVIGRMEVSDPVEYIDKKGRSVTVAPYEHVVILHGYDDNLGIIHFMSEGISYNAKYETFLASWKILGNMAVVKD
ncbi:MAG: C39 family peptidase, partial [Anaerolineae bacterium]|nr:C39 family peptidase [Anaerolineae bacterium]